MNRKTKLDLEPARKIVRSVPAIKAAIHESVKTPADVLGSLAPGVQCDETFIKVPTTSRTPYCLVSPAAS